MVGETSLDQAHEARLAGAPLAKDADRERAARVGRCAGQDPGIRVEAEPVVVAGIGFADGLVMDETELHPALLSTSSPWVRTLPSSAMRLPQTRDHPAGCGPGR